MANNIKPVQAESTAEGIDVRESLGRRAEGVENELWLVTSYLKLFMDLSAEAGRKSGNTERMSMDVDAGAFSLVMQDLAERSEAIQRRILDLAK